MWDETTRLRAFLASLADDFDSAKKDIEWEQKVGNGRGRTQT
jgi:hypothetical protein|tara:strand:+ start:1063 stop:1188 length:126 start_codon:yes stop_codon:yes gene_type:complete